MEKLNNIQDWEVHFDNQFPPACDLLWIDELKDGYTVTFVEIENRARQTRAIARSEGVKDFIRRLIDPKEHEKRNDQNQPA